MVCMGLLTMGGCTCVGYNFAKHVWVWVWVCRHVRPVLPYHCLPEKSDGHTPDEPRHLTQPTPMHLALPCATPHARLPPLHTSVPHINHGHPPGRWLQPLSSRTPPYGPVCRCRRSVCDDGDLDPLRPGVDVDGVRVARYTVSEQLQTRRRVPGSGPHLRDRP